jgi:hypothetical protein
VNIVKSAIAILAISAALAAGVVAFGFDFLVLVGSIALFLPLLYVAIALPWSLWVEPDFEIVESGIKFSGLRDEIRWDEIETIREAGGVTRLRLEAIVRDQKAVVDRARFGSKTYLAMHRLFGILRWRLSMHSLEKPNTTLDELEEQLNRLAGRKIVERRSWGNSKAEQMRKKLAYQSERLNREHRAKHGNG